VAAVDEKVVALWERAAATYETEVPYFTLMGARVVAHAALGAGEEVLDVACVAKAPRSCASDFFDPSARFQKCVAFCATAAGS
jgi:hypothetical protein